MIWTNETVGNLSVDYNFGAGAWAQERSLLRITIANTTSPQLVDIEWGEVASYMTDQEGKMLIDVSYVIRGEYAIGNTNGLITISNGNDVVDLAFVINGLINPENMLIPMIGKLLGTETLSEIVRIIPPTMWLKPIFGLSDSVEIFAREQSEVVLDYILLQDMVEKTITGGKATSEIVPGGADFIQIYDDVRTEKISFVRKDLICGRTYAAVEWVGRSGALKRHTFEAVKVTDNTNGVTEYLTPDNSYRISKGQEQEITLRLKGLTRYDYWYYSDIVTSSDVRVAIHEQDADFGDETRVAVTNKGVVQPDMNNVTDLEIAIKYRRYDEI